MPLTISPLSERVAILALIAVLAVIAGYLLFTGRDVPDWITGLIGMLASWLLGVKTSPSGGEVSTTPAQPSPPPPATGARNEPQSVAAPLPTDQVETNRAPARNERQVSVSRDLIVSYRKGRKPDTRPPFDPRQN